MIGIGSVICYGWTTKLRCSLFELFGFELYSRCNWFCKTSCIYYIHSFGINCLLKYLNLSFKSKILDFCCHQKSLFVRNSAQ